MVVSLVTLMYLLFGNFQKKMNKKVTCKPKLSKNKNVKNQKLKCNVPL